MNHQSICCNSADKSLLLFIFCFAEDKVNCTTGLPVCMQPGAEEPCIDEYGKYVAPVYMAVYMLFTNILLLNLLIAIFK